MSKLIWLAVVACIACKLLTRRWPWELLGLTAGGSTSANGRGRGRGRGRTQSRADQRARALLGVSANASPAEIIEAHRRLIAMVHPDRGGSSEQVHEANDARDLLLIGLTEIG